VTAFKWTPLLAATRCGLLFADGSVDFLAQTIGMPLYRRLSTVAEGSLAVLP